MEKSTEEGPSASLTRGIVLEKDGKATRRMKLHVRILAAVLLLAVICLFGLTIWTTNAIAGQEKKIDQLQETLEKIREMQNNAVDYTNFPELAGGEEKESSGDEEHGERSNEPDANAMGDPSDHALTDAVSSSQATTVNPLSTVTSSNSSTAQASTKAAKKATIVNTKHES